VNCILEFLEGTEDATLEAALAKERVKAPAEAVKEAEIVVIATPWSATEAAVKAWGAASRASS
jgi:predicted dinucleotide-binding enzyme